MDQNELPLGFSFALGQNPEAMQRFTVLTTEERSALLQKAHNVASKAEMRQLVQDLSNRA
ncbi:MAG: hypothetical protein E7464_08310 [Ruminococcaceae bacterium]|nr:hypothetical protein [Oscillospiraceae bacterium]